MPKIINRTKGHVLLEDAQGDERLCTMELLGQASYMGEKWLKKCDLVSQKKEHEENKA